MYVLKSQLVFFLVPRHFQSLGARRYRQPLYRPSEPAHRTRNPAAAAPFRRACRVRCSPRHRRRHRCIIIIIITIIVVVVRVRTTKRPCGRRRKPRRRRHLPSVCCTAPGSARRHRCRPYDTLDNREVPVAAVLDERAGGFWMAFLAPGVEPGFLLLSQAAESGPGFLLHAEERTVGGEGGEKGQPWCARPTVSSSGPLHRTITLYVQESACRGRQKRVLFFCSCNRKGMHGLRRAQRKPWPLTPT